MFSAHTSASGCGAGLNSSTRQSARSRATRRQRSSSARVRNSPSGGSASASSPSACSIASIEPKRSRWAGPRLVRIPIFGSTSSHSSATSPIRYDPSSATNVSCRGSSPSLIARTTPRKLLKEAGVGYAGPWASSAAATQPFVVVLPNEPEMPITSGRISRSLRWADRT